mgnify:CR=1 FL=1
MPMAPDGFSFPNENQLPYLLLHPFDSHPSLAVPGGLRAVNVAQVVRKLGAHL